MLLQQCIVPCSGIHGVGSGEEGKRWAPLSHAGPPSAPPRHSSAMRLMPNLIWHYTEKLHGMARVRRMRIENNEKTKNRKRFIGSEGGGGAMGWTPTEL